ncbi:MAG: hypothetical protein ACTSR0_01740 [Candidatus Asgardarchaeia archaeon]
MAKVKLDMFLCPLCRSPVKDLSLDIDVIQEIYIKEGKPVPIVTECPKKHSLIVYVYVTTTGNERKIVIREIKPALHTSEREKIALSIKKRDKRSRIDKAKNALEKL